MINDIGITVQSHRKSVRELLSKRSNWNELTILNNNVNISDIIANNTNTTNDTNHRQIIESYQNLPKHSDIYFSDPFDLKSDGLYKSQLPSMVDILLHDDEIDGSIALFTSSSTYLSRVTQRILREIRKHLMNKVLVDKWLELTNQQNTNKRIPYIQLLNYLSPYLPILNIPEDPVDEILTQPVFPEKSLAYGGKIGNWSEAASEYDRIGRYIDIKSNKQSDKRSIFRIHLHQLNIIDHPFVINEERQVHHLKQLYLQYKTLFNNRIINYLLYQTIGIFRELASQVQLFDNNNDINIEYLGVLLHNLIDMLPLLVESFDCLNNLTKGLIDGWQVLVDIRRQQGFLSTTTNMIISNISTHIRNENQTDGADNSIDRFFDIIKEDSDVWKELSTFSANITTVLEKAKAKHDSYVLTSPKLRSISSTVWDKIITYVNAIKPSIIPYPITLLHLLDDLEITPDINVNADELYRRRQWSEIKFKLVLCIDQQVITEVFSSKAHPLPFHVTFQQFLELRLFHSPNIVEIKIFSSKKGRYNYLSSVFLPTFTNYSRTVAHGVSPHSTWYMSSSEGLLQYDSNSCIPRSNPVSARFISALLATVEYDVSTTTNSINEGKPEELAIVPGNKSIYPALIYDKSFSSERDFISSLPPLPFIDINDPRNEEILTSHRSSNKINKDIFQLSSKSNLLVCYSENGISYDDFMRIQPNLRIKLLKLRHKNPNLFTEPIPFYDELIKSNEFYKQLLDEDIADTYFSSELRDKSNETTSQETSNKSKVSDFLSRVQLSRTSRTRQRSSKVLSTQSLVNEKDYFGNRLDVGLENLLPERKRGLKPKVQKRSPATLQIRSCNLLVQVVGVRNVPLREESDDNMRDSTNQPFSSPNKFNSTFSSPNRANIRTIDRQTNNPANSPQPNNPPINQVIEDSTPLLSNDLFDEAKLKERLRARTFMEVSFQENSFETNPVDGVSPEWKHLGSLPFHPPRDDFSPLNLQQVRDEIVFTLFDSFIENDQDRVAHLEGENTTRVEKKYLGRFTVPFSTLYRLGKVEGSFRAETPIFNFGYNHIRSISRQIVIPNQILAPSRPSIWTSIFECSCFNSKPNVIIENNDVMNDERSTEISYFFGGKQTTYFQVMITLDPPLLSPDSQSVLIAVQSTINPATLHTPDKSYAAYLSSWLRRLKDKCPKRLFKLLVMSSKGSDVLVIRYLTPQIPPDGFLNKRACLHLVSQIPFLPDTQAFVGESDLWCTLHEVFDLGCGDEEEHAVVLYNYFYYLKTPLPTNTNTTTAVSIYPPDEIIRNETIFLVLGKAIPEGDTVYLLVRKTFFDRNDGTNRNYNFGYKANSYYLINPCTGNIYEASDSDCPLKELICLVTPFNYWANIQLETVPTSLDYDITNIKNWVPFFNRDTFPYPSTGLATIQKDVTYQPTSLSYALEVENLIIDNIKRSFRRWRSKRIQSNTTFHPDCSTVITDILPKLETWKRTGKLEDNNTRTLDSSNETINDPMDYIQFEVKSKLRTMLRSRILKGFPLNIPFTDVETIIQEIKELCVHETTHPSIQFVLAVRCFPLVNNLLSIWIFIGTLESNR